MKYLVTGGSGFVGSNFIHRCLELDKNSKIINVDAMSIGSNILNNNDLKSPNYRFVQGNICDQALMNKLVNSVDYVINFAAESHVDRSIKNAKPFIKSNIVGVHTILESIRNHKQVKLIHISTDEVYGEVSKGRSTEHDELNPSNPYASSKASAEMLIRSYRKTFDIDVKITRCTNNFGPRQFAEKLIPRTIISALNDIQIPIHGDGSAIRQWIHVFDHCDAILQIISKWGKSLTYNVASNYENTNLVLVKKILNLLDKPDLITFVEDRPGQDKRYSIDPSLIRKEIGFKPKIKFNVGLESTIDWYIQNKKWWKDISLKKINPTLWLK
ncbi:MAG: dTDP-glucose 4,6-dehydratase [Nitrosarchaeum sp.]|nr:dTDP-glucose 4,6-dehydratase [Nitrosarchaeum sp.]